MLTKEENFDLKNCSIELAQFYLGAKLVQENQEFDFSWNAFPKKAAHLISMISALKMKNKYSNIDIKYVETESYKIVEEYLNDKLQEIFDNILIDFLPLNVLTKNQAYISFNYSITTLNSVKSLLDLAIERNIKIEECKLNAFFAYLCYKSTTALSIINSDNNDFCDINMTKEEAYFCSLNSQNYAIYLLENEEEKLNKIKNHFSFNNKDIFSTISDFYIKKQTN